MLGEGAVSLDLNLGGYEASALEEAVLPAPVGLSVERSNREGEVFLGSYFSTRIKYYLEPTMECLAIKIDKFSFCVNHLGVYLSFAVRTILIQAIWIPIFLTFSNIKFMFNIIVHKIEVCCISLHTLEVTLQLFQRQHGVE